MTQDEFDALPRETRLPSIAPWYPEADTAIERYNEAYDAYVEITRFNAMATFWQVVCVLAFTLALVSLFVVLG